MYGHPNHPDPTTSGPPLPEWRASAALRPPQSQSAPPAPATQPHPPSAAYNPAAFGPISNSSVAGRAASGTGHGTSTWGVRYNQQQQQLVQAPPPVPPRPSSTNEQPYVHSQSQQHPLAGLPNKPLPPSPQTSTDTLIAWSTNPPPPFTPIPAISPAPAPPPKIPRDEHQSNRRGGLTVRPPLLAQGSGPAAMTGSYGFPQRTADSAPTSASALGPGAPSDWEHLSPTPGDFEDSPWFPSRRNSSSHLGNAVLTPPGYTSGIPNEIQHRQSVSSFPTTDSGPFRSPVSEVEGPSQRDIYYSPVSPATFQAMQTPPPRLRINMMGSSAFSPISVTEHSESIDPLIESLVRPKSAEAEAVSPYQEQATPRPNSQDAANEKSPVESTRSAKVNQSPEQGVRADPQVRTSSTKTKQDTAQSKLPAPDRYEDLDPWFRSSLVRFVSMLRKEAVADSDEERYKIFTAFIGKEAKLREILYNIEADSHDLRHARRGSVQTPRQSSPKSDARRPSIESGLIPSEPEDGPPPSLSTGNGDEMDDGGSEYSSGGRPLLGKLARHSSVGLPVLSSVGEEKEVAGRSLRSVSVPPVVGEVPKQAFQPLTTNRPRPIYTPFRYTEGPQRGSDHLTFDRPAYEAYNDLRQASAVSGRVMSNTPAPSPRSRSNTSTSPAQNEHGETFLGLIRDKSGAYQTSSRRNSVPPSSMLPDPLRQARPSKLVEELRTMVLTPLDKQSESSWHRTIREELDKLPDDFSYIQEAVSHWETTTQPRRQKLDQERMARQEESEEQIDDLFNEKEIGYADINTLEEEFRQTEARVQLDEERREVEDFTTQVFNPLDERLKGEISVLRKAFNAALNELDRHQKGKNSSAEQSSTSVTMWMVNDIHNKLEIRFQKRLELALDCERRRKKAERRPLVFMGDTLGLRQLDGDFDRMERRNLLEAAKDRDDRANQLMDSFDDAILNGLGMNQRLLDELASKAAQLDPTALHTSGIPDSEVEQILKSAATFAAMLRAESEAILHSFGVADMALNVADYSVSVAEAWYANSDPDTLHRLDAEKKKEDTKIQNDLHAKMQSIQKSPADIEATIQRLLQALAEGPLPTAAPVSLKQDTPPPNRPAASSSPDPRSLIDASISVSDDEVSDEELEHQERIRKALEDAKKRNAVRNYP